MNVAVRLRLGARPAVRGCLVNASISGAFVRIHGEFPVYAHVLLEIEHEGTESQPIDAYVARSTPAGLGLEWCEFAPEEIANLLTPAVGQCRSRSKEILGELQCAPLPRHPV